MTTRRLLRIAGYLFILGTVAVILLGGNMRAISQEQLTLDGVSHEHAQLVATLALSQAIASQQREVNQRLRRDLVQRFHLTGDLADSHRLLHDQFALIAATNHVVLVTFEIRKNNTLNAVFHGNDNAVIKTLQAMDRLALPLAPSTVTLTATAPNVISATVDGAFLGGPLDEY
jgi:hypothetical protein